MNFVIVSNILFGCGRLQMVMREVGEGKVPAFSNAVAETNISSKKPSRWGKKKAK